MLHSTRQKSTTQTQKIDQGFSLIELLIVVAIVMVLAAITVPRILNAISDTKLRYFATNYSGILQSARMQAVRKNIYYQIQSTTLSSGGSAYFVDIPKSGSYAVGDPLLPVGSQITVHVGTGSGAPNEGTFTSGTSTSGLSFAPISGASDPSFNARGLPCVVASGACPYSGQGFVVFLSKPSLTGNLDWAAVAITPSGHIQIWTCDGSGYWIQRD